MQDSTARKSWYQRAIEMSTLWKTINFKTKEIIPATTNASLWKTIPCKSIGNPTSTTNSNSNFNSNSKKSNKLRKCTSLKVATSFTRVCLCAPISSYNEVFRAEVPPRRSNSYPRSKPLPTSSSSLSSSSSSQLEARVFSSARHSMEGGSRRIFRGKSLTDDVLMRRFVIEEEAMMQVRRRNQMEVIRKRSVTRRNKIGLSRLSRMIVAEDN
ncbi:Serine/threonine protein kinase [Quillaja saponaria]|uniref:Serine/threonine protein kinase n=1 Tax=Quillaja saponaria TaxID=32244 RepID=A0AAD7KX72_QUISA|nr:Serine/threonine protein kinase [Quillaja saponaria]